MSHARMRSLNPYAGQAGEAPRRLHHSQSAPRGRGAGGTPSTLVPSAAPRVWLNPEYGPPLIGEFCPGLRDYGRTTLGAVTARLHRVGASLLFGGCGEVTATEVGSREVGLSQRIAVEPHLTSRSVQVLPETEGQVEIEVRAELDQAVEGKSQFVVLQEFQGR